MGMKFNRFLFLLLFVVFLVGCNFSSGEDEKSGDGGMSPDPFALVEGEWADATISKKGQINEYTIKVTEGTQYFVYFNAENAATSTTSASEVVGSSHGYLISAMDVKISYSDGTAIDSKRMLYSDGGVYDEGKKSVR